MMAVHRVVIGLWQRSGVTHDAFSPDGVTVRGEGFPSREKDRNPACPRPALHRARRPRGSSQRQLRLPPGLSDKGFRGLHLWRRSSSTGCFSPYSLHTAVLFEGLSLTTAVECHVDFKRTLLVDTGCVTPFSRDEPCCAGHPPTQALGTQLERPLGTFVGLCVSYFWVLPGGPRERLTDWTPLSVRVISPPQSLRVEKPSLQGEMGHLLVLISVFYSEIDHRLFYWPFVFLFWKMFILFAHFFYFCRFKC